MKILNRPPKLQWLIKLFFPGYDFDRVVAFAFGDTIYTHFDPIADYDLIHEKVHLRQMRYSKLYGIIHFIKFFFSRRFRYKTELEAYQEEYKYIQKIAPNQGYQAAQKFAEVLSGQGKNAYIIGKVAEYDIALFEILSYN